MNRHRLLAAVVKAQADLLSRISEHARAQDRQFEIDITIGRATEAWHDAPITEDDLDFLQEALTRLRGLLTEIDLGAFVSIRDIGRAEDEDMVA